MKDYHLLSGIRRRINVFFIRLARKIFKKSFEKDDGFRMSYRANIAVLLYDRYDITERDKRDKIADDIMKVIFDAEEVSKKEEIYCVPIKDRFEILDL